MRCGVRFSVLLWASAHSLFPSTFHDIAPIIYTNCAPCHRPGEPGPFPLLTYQDVKKHAHQIAAVTRSRYMPPWLPEPGYGDFQDERRLTDAQIKAISDWVHLLVLNTHLQPSGKPEQVQPIIGLYFTDKPPTHFPILIQLENDNALNIPPGDRDFVTSDDFRLPVDVDVLAVYPHAHYLGKLLEAYATLPNGSRKWLIRIPHWDLNWQAVYCYRRPVFLPKGAVISMRYHYDNSASNPRNPNHPPKRLKAGNQATDEMGHLWLQLLPRGAGDHRRTVQEALMRHRLEKYPNDFSAHLNLGAILLSRLDMQGAAGMLEAAVRLNPNSPEAHDMLGSALRNLGEQTAAITQFRLALKAQPDYINAHYDLALALAKSGNFPEAITHLQKVIAAFPNNARLRNQLSTLLAHRTATVRERLRPHS